MPVHRNLKVDLFATLKKPFATCGKWGEWTDDVNIKWNEQTSNYIFGINLIKCFLNFRTSRVIKNIFVKSTYIHGSIRTYTRNLS